MSLLGQNLSHKVNPQQPGHMFGHYSLGSRSHMLAVGWFIFSNIMKATLNFDLRTPSTFIGGGGGCATLNLRGGFLRPTRST